MYISLPVLLSSSKDHSGEMLYELGCALTHGSPTFLRASPLRERSYAFVESDIDFVAASTLETGDFSETDIAAVVRLLNGDWAALEAGCDPTGWDCQSWCDIRIGPDLSDVVNYGLSEEARRLLMQLVLNRPNQLLRK